MNVLKLDWNTPAGRILRELCLEVGVSARITVFGSAPLQMTVEPNLLSQDVDVFADVDLSAIVEKHALGVGQRAVGIQVCSELNFRTTPQWLVRATVETIGLCQVVFPHPIDILVGKLHRLEDKDLKAFRVVIDRTGHPTEAEMIEELQKAVDLFRPGFDEESAGDMTATTALLWREVFGRAIDVRAEIIAPALALRKKGYGHDLPDADHRETLREAAKGAAIPPG